MSLSSDIAVLRRVPFFERFDEDHLRLLAFGGENQHHDPDTVLYTKGDASEGGYVVLSGQVKLLQEDDDEGERFKVATLLGQRALLASTKRRHTAITVTRSEIMLIRRTTFMRMLTEFPDLAAELYADMSAELINLTGRATQVVGRR